MDNTNNLNNYQKSDNGDINDRSTVDRKWVALTAYQPVDVVTKTVEVPIIKTVEKIVPRIIVQEKIVHVPKNVTHVVEKIVEVPEVKYIEKIVEVPHIHYKNKYIPKVEVIEKIVERQKVIEKWHDKIVEVPQIKEVVRYKEIEDAEEIIKYIPKNSRNIDWEDEYKKYLQRKELAGYNVDNSLSYQQNINAFNDHNANVYAQHSYDKNYDYINNQTNLNGHVTDIKYDNYPQFNYQNQANRINYEQLKTIPKSYFNANESLRIQKVESEEKQAGCCSGVCS